jgi:hypothetical protein
MLPPGRYNQHWLIKPVFLQVFNSAPTSLLSVEASGQTSFDMIILAFSFLLQPGEYAYSSSPASPLLYLWCTLFCEAPAMQESLMPWPLWLLSFQPTEGVCREPFGLSHAGSPTRCLLAIFHSLTHFQQTQCTSHHPDIYLACMLSGCWGNLSSRCITLSLFKLLKQPLPLAFYPLKPADMSSLT